MRVRQPGRTLVPIQSFQDVLAGRSVNRREPGVLWPDFDTQTHARLWRNNRILCTRPDIDGTAPDIVAEPAVFVSMYDNHFGHMVAETVPRLPQSLAEAPDLPLYFSCAWPTGIHHTSGMFRSVLDWLGVPRDRVRFIHKPTLFRELHIAAQAEHLDGPPPAEGYIDLLEARIAGRIAPVRPEGVTFVTRAGLAAHSGRHAGESYLVACLRELGVRIVYPEELPLPEQMRIYAQSRHLVFSEGSALHGRQLLGRTDQHISILRRRFRSDIARNQLAPRCASLTYVPCFGGSLHVTDEGGRGIGHAMASLFSIPPLLEHFEALGVPLGRIWNAGIYRQSRDHDVLEWIAAMYGPGIEHWLKPHNDDAYLLDQFEPLGLGHLRAEAAAMMRAGDGTRPRVDQRRAAGGARRGGPTLARRSPGFGEAVSELAVRGENGIDLFARIEDRASGRVRYRCVATWTGPGAHASLHIHEPAPGRSAQALVQIALAAAGDPALVCRFSLFDPAGWPEAGTGEDPMRLFLHHEFFRAWQVADMAARRFLARIDAIPDALAAEPDKLTVSVAPLYDFNRLTLGVRAARQVQPVLLERIASDRLPGGASESIGYALRMLGDLCGRAGQHELSLACHETAIRAGDNPFRRRRAIEAAQALGDGPARDAHLAAFQERWALPADLARLVAR